MTVSTTQLQLYNKAIRHLGGRKMASLSEENEYRRYLDDEYADTLLLCLRSGYWNFAMRSVAIDASESVVPTFGYTAAFEKPSDWLKTYIVSTDENYTQPLRDYQDQGGYWLANPILLYVRYVSSELGLTLSAWPVDFSEYVGVALARAICLRITNGKDLFDAIEKREQKYLKRAQSTDAMDQAPARTPHGTWVTSRAVRGGAWSDYNRT